MFHEEDERNMTSGAKTSTGFFKVPLEEGKGLREEAVEEDAKRWSKMDQVITLL